MIKTALVKPFGASFIIHIMRRRLNVACLKRFIKVVDKAERFGYNGIN
jgi:hypothetical protein